MHVPRQKKPSSHILHFTNNNDKIKIGTYKESEYTRYIYLVFYVMVNLLALPRPHPLRYSRQTNVSTGITYNIIITYPCGRSSRLQFVAKRHVPFAVYTTEIHKV